MSAVKRPFSVEDLISAGGFIISPQKNNRQKNTVEFFENVVEETKNNVVEPKFIEIDGNKFEIVHQIGVGNRHTIMYKDPSIPNVLGSYTYTS